MKMSSTERFQTKGQGQGQGSIHQKTLNAETKEEQIHTSTDSHVEQNLGVTHTSKSKHLKNCKLTYQDLFYRPIKSKTCLSAQRGGDIRGFPTRQSQYCTSECKREAMRQMGIPKQSKKNAMVYRRTQSQCSKDFQYQSTEEIGARNSNKRVFGFAPSCRGQNKYCDIPWHSL